MSSWMLDEEESQERIGRNDVRQGQERNGEAAHGQVRARRANKSRRRIRHSVAGKEGGDPVTDWERVDDGALCVRMAADYSDEAIHCGYWQVFRCGETLRQRGDRYTENRTHHVGTVPAV